MVVQALAFGLAAGVSTGLGGLLALRLAGRLSLVMAFSGGAVIGVAFLEVLPEALEQSGDPRRTGAIAAVAFLGFLAFERLLVLHHRETTEEMAGHPQVGVLGAAGLSLHSLIDGFAIGVAFAASARVGMVVAVAVLLHDFSDGLNTVTVVLSQGNPARRARRWLAVDASAPLVGAALGSWLRLDPAALSWILAAYVGFFLHIGADDMLSHAHEHTSAGRLALTGAGFGAIFAATLLAG